MLFRSYLGRYSHRVAISNSRLVSLDHGHVCFRWKDYADGSQTKVMRLSADEFLRRFLLHVLPRGFVRIRHSGLLASSNVAVKLRRCHELLNAALKPSREVKGKTWIDRVLEWTGQDPMRCPHCQSPLIRLPFHQPLPTPIGARPTLGPRSSTVPSNTS